MNLAYVLVAAVVLLGAGYVLNNVRLRRMPLPRFVELARNALLRGDARWAQRVFDERVRESPEDPSLVELHIVRLARTCGEDGAIRWLETTANASSDPAPLWFLQGVFLMEWQRLEESADACRRAVEADPAFADAWVNLGTAIDEKGRPEQAIAIYDQILKSRPTEDYAWNNKAKSLRDLGRHAESLECYQRARALGHPGAEESVRRALLYLGRVDEANGCAFSKDRLGGAYEVRKIVGDQTVVARGFDGRHTHPELVREAARVLVDAAADIAARGALKHGDTVHVLYPRVHVVEREQEFILGERHDPLRDLVAEEVSNAARDLVAMQGLLDICSVSATLTTPEMNARVEAAVCDGGEAVLERVASDDPRDSGWRVHLQSSEPQWTTVSLEALSVLHPALRRIATFPVGTRAEAEEEVIHEITLDGTVLYARAD